MSYRYLEHKTDLLIEVDAKTLDEAFSIAGYSIIESMINRHKVSIKKFEVMTIYGKNLQYVLYNWLEEIIILIITKGFAVKKIITKFNHTKCKLYAKIFGEELDIKRHGFKLEIKSPTFHLMKIGKNKNGVKMIFLLDL